MDGTRSDQNLRPRPTPVRALGSSLSISRVSDAYATFSLSSSISSPCIITQGRYPWPRTCSPNGVHNRRPCVRQQKLQEEEEEEAGSRDLAARNQLTVCVSQREDEGNVYGCLMLEQTGVQTDFSRSLHSVNYWSALLNCRVFGPQ